TTSMPGLWAPRWCSASGSFQPFPPVARTRLGAIAAFCFATPSGTTRALHRTDRSAEGGLRMKSLGSLLIIALLAGPGLARADVAMGWNEITVAAAARGKHGASDASRTTALVHAAMFDAVNAVEARYTPYKVAVKAPAGASPDAAAVSAAHAVLVRLYPDQKPALDQASAKSLARIGDGSAKTDGIAIGEKL